MLKPFTTAVVAASVWAAVSAAPATAVANSAAVAPAATSTDATARAQAAPTTKRMRKTGFRRVAAVAAPAPYHSQCFLFWCPSGSRHVSVLMLGIGF